jgi:hypothetical protein
MRAHLLPKLRCQFAEFLNHDSLKRLGMLSLPTCVGFRYGHHKSSTRGFSWKHGLTRYTSSEDSVSHNFSALVSSRFYPRNSAYKLVSGQSAPRPGYPSPSPLVSTNLRWHRNINLFSIDYGFRPCLRNRLTLGGLTCPRNPWDFGEQVSHLFSRYSCWHYHL